MFTATLLNLPPIVGHKYPNDESTTYDHNDESLCRRCELMRTVTLSFDYIKKKKHILRKTIKMSLLGIFYWTRFPGQIFPWFAVQLNKWKLRA